MNAFEWNTSFETGLEQVDEQHKALVDLINRYSAVVAAGKPLDLAQVEKVCDELADYARYHFTEEQVSMDELGVDSRHITHHVREHADLFLDLARMRTEVSAGMPDAPRHLLDFLVHWLASHILDCDQSLARQIAAMNAGRTPAEAYALEERAAGGAAGILVKSLNGLSKVVSERSRELFELNRSLETRVLQRTRELSVANERLSRVVERLQNEQKETQRLSDELSAANRDLEVHAMVDRLTGLPNLQYALARLTSEIASAKQFGHPLSVVLFAADGFKQANDSFGPTAGDEIIKALGEVLRKNFPSHDVVCHVGVDEFIAICPQVNHVGTILKIDQVRSALSWLVVPIGSGAWKGSASAGIAEWGPDLDSVKKLMQAATSRRRPLEA